MPLTVGILSGFGSNMTGLFRISCWRSVTSFLTSSICCSKCSTVLSINSLVEALFNLSFCLADFVRYIVCFIQVNYSVCLDLLAFGAHQLFWLCFLVIQLFCIVQINLLVCLDLIGFVVLWFACFVQIDVLSIWFNRILFQLFTFILWLLFHFFFGVSLFQYFSIFTVSFCQ